MKNVPNFRKKLLLKVLFTALNFCLLGRYNMGVVNILVLSSEPPFSEPEPDPLQFILDESEATSESKHGLPLEIPV